MSRPDSAGSEADSAADSDLSSRPGLIHARGVRHPGRWVAVLVVLLLLAMLISSFLTNERWDFGLAGRIMIQQPVIEGLAKGTLLVTVASMAFGVIVGTVVAVLRLSKNPVLRSLSFAFTWFFRAVPRYVLLTIIGTGLGYLYSTLRIGVPFGQHLSAMLGLSSDLTFWTIDMNTLGNGIAGAILGLGLSEAAYMAEIARAGILSVDRGQVEAAEALGMSGSLTMRRIVLPQAMRVIVPPTGNETIAMVKDTSLLIALPLITELNYQAMAIGNRLFKIMPAIVAATAWYLVICSVLMVCQVYLERYFGRGFGEARVGRPGNRRFARPGGMGGA